MNTTIQFDTEETVEECYVYDPDVNLELFVDESLYQSLLLLSILLKVILLDIAVLV